MGNAMLRDQAMVLDQAPVVLPAAECAAHGHLALAEHHEVARLSAELGFQVAARNRARELYAGLYAHRYTPLLAWLLSAPAQHARSASARKYHGLIVIGNIRQIKARGWNENEFDLAAMDAQDEGELVIKHPKTLEPTGWVWTFYRPGHAVTTALSNRVAGRR
jgi:hypothetical protein